MILSDNGEIESEEESDYESMPALEDGGDVEYPKGRDIMFIRRALNMQVKEEMGDEIQCENIFHIRCLIHDKTCSLIIDGRSCANVACSILVQKLNLSTLKHLRPYNLLWLNECGDVKVTK